MASVAIEKYRDAGKVPQRLWDELNEITEKVRQQAFNLFERRGMIGSDLDNWLAAENEVIWKPASELIEKDGTYEAQIAVPGFEPKEIQVMATPESLIVEAQTTHTHEGKEGKVCLCEFSDKKMFRRLDLPSRIDVDKATAQLENGMLRVRAPKAA